MANAIGNLATAGIQTYGIKKTGTEGNGGNTGETKFSIKNSNIGQSDIDKAKNMYLGNDYLRKFLQYK